MILHYSTNKLKESIETQQAIDSALRVQSHTVWNNPIEFTEIADSLCASELIDFTRVQMLETVDGFVGSSTGVLKGLKMVNSTFVNYRVPKKLHDVEDLQTSSTMNIPITTLCFTGEDQTEILVGRKNGQVDLFNTSTETFSQLFPIAEEDKWIKGIHSVQNFHILTGTASGHLAVWNPSGERLSKPEWTAGDSLLTLQMACGNAIFATGGRENPLKLWNIEDGKCIFTAKNVRPDMLELRVPVCVTNCRFINNSTNCVITSTENAQIRLYDTRVQRRPTIQQTWLDEPIQALSNCCKEWHILAGNNRGQLGLFDFRASTKDKLVSKYKGFAGTIRSIDASATEPQILSCGADRYAILHNLITREAIKKIYCKVQLNCCLIRNDVSLILPNRL